MLGQEEGVRCWDRDKANGMGVGMSLARETEEVADALEGERKQKSESI